MKKHSDKRQPKEGRGAQERAAFDSPRQPAAPHGHALTRAKPEERAHPAERKAKHKRRPGDAE